jgi:hypothetical protein
LEVTSPRRRSLRTEDRPTRRRSSAIADDLAAPWFEFIDDLPQFEEHAR